MRIVCIGDSIVRGKAGDESEGIGWAGRIAKRTLDKHLFYNLGINGDTIMDVYHRCVGEALRREPELLIVGCGANDIKEHTKTSGPAISEPQRLVYWEGLLSCATKQVGKVVVLSILPVIEERLKFLRRNETILTYNQQLKELCEKFGATFIDLHTDFAKEDVPALLFDGVHPNSAGYTWLAERIYNELEQRELI